MARTFIVDLRGIPDTGAMRDPSARERFRIIDRFPETARRPDVLRVRCEHVGRGPMADFVREGFCAVGRVGASLSGIREAQASAIMAQRRGQLGRSIAKIAARRLGIDAAGLSVRWEQSE